MIPLAGVIAGQQAPTPPSDQNAILLESGSGFIELEDGSGIILLETAP